MIFEINFSSLSMEYLQEEDRDQLTLYTTCLDDMVPLDNTVRLIDQFVEALDLGQIGFESLAQQGRPPYHPNDLLNYTFKDT